MKKIPLLITCALVWSCNKPLPDPSLGPFDYTVSPPDTVSLPANDQASLVAQLTVTSGDASQNPVTVSITGLPANVGVAKNNFPLKLNNTISDSIGADNAVQGNYPVEIELTSPAGKKTANFILAITAPINRVQKVMGYFYPSNSCWGNIYVSCTIDSVQGAPGKIMIIDRTSPDEMSYGTFDTTYGQVDCCSNTFTIPSQKVQGATVTGYGAINAQTYPYATGSITRNFVTDSSSYSCTVTLGQN